MSDFSEMSPAAQEALDQVRDWAGAMPDEASRAFFLQELQLGLQMIPGGMVSFADRSPLDYVEDGMDLETAQAMLHAAAEKYAESDRIHSVPEAIYTVKDDFIKTDDVEP